MEATRIAGSGQQRPVEVAIVTDRRYGANS